MRHWVTISPVISVMQNLGKETLVFVMWIRVQRCNFFRFREMQSYPYQIYELPLVTNYLNINIMRCVGLILLPPIFGKLVKYIWNSSRTSNTLIDACGECLLRCNRQVAQIVKVKDFSDR